MITLRTSVGGSRGQFAARTSHKPREVPRRKAAMAKVRVVEADAVSYRPEAPADLVYLSYSLTMMQDWQGALNNALGMLRPGGRLGVVDFYVSDADPPPRLPDHVLHEGVGSVPYLPGLRVPYYLFVGRRG